MGAPGHPMSLRDLCLAIHITAGTTGLILGPLAMRAPKRRGPHTRLGETYHWVMLAVCLSAAALASLAAHLVVLADRRLQLRQRPPRLPRRQTTPAGLVAATHPGNGRLIHRPHHRTTGRKLRPAAPDRVAPADHHRLTDHRLGPKRSRPRPTPQTSGKPFAAQGITPIPWAASANRFPPD
jgi:hypothetical protein